MKRFFDKVAQHLDKLDAESVRGQYKGLADEFAFLEAVLRTMGEGVIVATGNGELAYANPAAEQLAHFDFQRGHTAVISFCSPLSWIEPLGVSVAAPTPG